MSELIPAATVIPLRDTPSGIEVLMLRKNSKLAFGGMWVFPGGRIDDDDDVDGDEEQTAQRAAVREALEEADLLVDPTGLVPFSHWTPPEVSLNGPKRFATWFFVCRAPVGEAGEVTIDGGEIHDDEWVRPVDMLRRRDEGDIQLAPPTIVTLYDLAPHDTVDEALAAAAARTPFRYATRVGNTDEGMVTMWEGDAGYESGDAEAPGPRHRLLMADPVWRFEDSR
ncbi:NUDIX hydrolase [Actinospongicola halichondriae]|uniref:NUDIX hydrolase n=1 Tax=Actinospongicola halichondriae TaxID=3236844 RepID=UPI003D582C15